MKRSTVPALLIPLAAATLAFPSALASAADTTVGDSSSPNQTCPKSAYTQVQISAPGSNPGYAIPSDGVITAYSVAASPGTIRALKVARLVNGVWTITGESSKSTVPDAGIVTAQTRVVVQAGDVLGQYVEGAARDGGNPLCEHGSDGSVRYESGDVGLGGTVTRPVSGVREAVSAVVELDADRDGYGDTTQDKCLGNPAHDPCFTGALGKAGGKARVKKTLTAPSVTLQPGVTESFQWFRVTKKKGHHRTVTKPIGGATGPTYKAKKKDRGKKVFVRVTLSAPGFTSTSADSVPRKVK